MKRLDLSGYSDQELSLQVFNDEGLYRQRHWPDFVTILSEFFIYTNDQLSILLDDLKVDKLQEMEVYND